MNKEDADQQSGQRLCYSLSGKYNSQTGSMLYFSILASLCSWADWHESYLIVNRRFAKNEAQMWIACYKWFTWNIIQPYWYMPWKIKMAQWRKMAHFIICYNHAPILKNAEKDVLLWLDMSVHLEHSYLEARYERLLHNNMLSKAFKRV